MSTKQRFLGAGLVVSLFVVGVAGVTRPFNVAARLAGGVDYWIMIVVSAGFVLMAVIGRKVIGRASGALLLCVYIGYMVYVLAYSAVV